MFRVLPVLSAAFLLAAATVPAASAATPCRDAKGKFITCPPPAAAKKTACRDAKGKFTKCDAMTPGTAAATTSAGH